MLAEESTGGCAGQHDSEDGQVADAVAMKKDVPLLVIIGAVKGGAQERVMTGQALMKLCLTAASRGLCVTTLNQICEVP